MKKRMQYTREKFAGFENSKKLRVIISFIDAIERAWSDEEERGRLLPEFNKCLHYLADSSDRFLREIAQPLLQLSSPTYEEFLAATAELRQRFGKEPLDHDLPGMRREVGRPLRKVPLYAILVNLRSAFNVGSIIRTSECIGIEKIYMCGYTATPDHKKVRKTAMATEERVIWERRESVSGLMSELREREGVELIALETGPLSKPLHKSRIHQPAALIVGNEAHGLPEDILRMADQVLSIPLAGWKGSFNVGVAFGIACYEIVKQWNMIEEVQEEI